MSRAARAVLDGAARITEAEEAVAATQRTTAERWVEGSEAQQSGDLREARARLADAEEATALARAGRDELRALLDKTGDIEACRLVQREAVQAVLRAELQGQADAMALQAIEQLDSLIGQAELIRLLAERAGLFATSRSQGNLVGTIGALARLTQTISTPGSAQARAAGSATFQAMVDALISDPDATIGF